MERSLISLALLLQIEVEANITTLVGVNTLAWVESQIVKTAYNVPK